MTSPKSQTMVKSILAGDVPAGSHVTIKGWVRTRRDSKSGGGLSFVHISDGSCFDPLQVVAASSLPNYATEDDTPMIAATIDVPGGWNKKNKFSLSLKEIGDWPTHKRFREAKAGRAAGNENELREALNMYLKDRSIDSKERRKFVEDEITFTDASSGKKTAEFILQTLERIAQGSAPRALPR